METYSIVSMSFPDGKSGLKRWRLTLEDPRSKAKTPTKTPQPGDGRT